MKHVLSIALIALVFSASAQYRSGGGGGDKVYFGGGFGLSFGTDVTSVSASPLVGYKFTDQLSAGVRLTYQYVNNKIYDVSFSNYGGGPFTRFQVTDKYFTHFEYEFLNFEYATGRVINNELETERDSYNALWLGAGYREDVGRNAGFFMVALYNVLYDENEPSPYASPLSIRAGFAVGF